MSIKKYESVDLKHFNESKAFIDYSNDVIDIFENIYEYNSKKKKKKKKKWILLLLSLILLCKKILDWTLLYYNNFEQKKGSTNSN